MYMVAVLTICVVFYKLYTKMKKYHRYEFETNQRPMMHSFRCMVAVIVLTILYNQAVSDEEIPMIRKPNFHESHFFCHGNQYGFALEFLVYIPGVNFKLISIVISYVIICQKNTIDILQGVSKLDHLLKICIF